MKTIHCNAENGKYHEFWGGDVSGTLIRIIIRGKGGQDCQAIENLERNKHPFEQKLPLDHRVCFRLFVRQSRGGHMQMKFLKGIYIKIHLMFINLCAHVRVNLLVVLSETQQQLIVKTLEVLA